MMGTDISACHNAAEEWLHCLFMSLCRHLQPSTLASQCFKCLQIGLTWPKPNRFFITISLVSQEYNSHNYIIRNYTLDLLL